MSKKKTTGEFIEELKAVHGDKFTVLGDYQGRSKKVLVRCNVCGAKYGAIPNSLLNGRGCKFCAKNVNLTIEEVQKSVDKAYGPNIFKLLTPYESNHKKMLIQHIASGQTFEQTRSHLLEGFNLHGKSKVPLLQATYKKLKATRKYVPVSETPEQKSAKQKAKNEELQQQLNKKFNGQFTIVKGDYVNLQSRIVYHCNVCGQNVETSVNLLLTSGKCKVCSGFTVSTGEQLIYGLLLSNNIEFEYHKSLKLPERKHPLHLDFYIPSKRVAIEFDGQQHYDSNDRYYHADGVVRDVLKDCWANDNLIKLIRLRDYSPKALIDSLMPYLGKLDSTSLMTLGAGQTPIKAIYAYSKEHTYTDTIEYFHIYYDKLYDIIELYSGKRPTVKHPKVYNDETFKRELAKKWHNRFKPLEPYQGVQTKILVHCNQCQQDFRTVPATLLNSQRESGGCPYCAHNIRWNLDMIKQVLPNLYPLKGFPEGQYKLLTDTFKNSHTKMLFHCNKCDKDIEITWHDLKIAHGCDCSSVRFGDSSDISNLINYKSTLHYNF